MWVVHIQKYDNLLSSAVNVKVKCFIVSCETHLKLRAHVAETLENVACFPNEMFSKHTS